MHSLELDIKNTALDLAKIGAERAVKDYIKENVAIGKPPNINEAKAMARLRAHDEIKKLANLKDDTFDFKIWCGFVDETELRNLRDKMLKERNSLTCNECFEIENIACAEFIQVDASIDRENADGSATVQFWKESLDNGVIGISIYSFEMASVSYIPASEVR
ncbi:hypothetical protein J4450_01480 [Candidatus Micrarchaeota archaeon]|nr:hypothetical protein [Candidatus Micrarchaeota archaeon]